MLYICVIWPIADLVLAFLFHCQLGSEAGHQRHSQGGFGAAQDLSLPEPQHSRLWLLLSYGGKTWCSAPRNQRVVPLSSHEYSPGVSQAARRRQDCFSACISTSSGYRLQGLW